MRLAVGCEHIVAMARFWCSIRHEIALESAARATGHNSDLSFDNLSWHETSFSPFMRQECAMFPSQVLLDLTRGIFLAVERE